MLFPTQIIISKTFKVCAILFSLLSVLLISVLIYRSIPGIAQIHFIDVGYGDSILITYRHKLTVLIDAGPEAHAKTLIGYLKRQNISKIDYLFISHFHENHWGGLKEILKTWSVSHVLFNFPLSHFPDKDLQESLKSLKVTGYRKGDEILKEGLRLEVLNPQKITDDEHANSLALLLTFGRTSLLLTSDISQTIQDSIIDDLKSRKKPSVVQIPHHGGPMSGTFIKTFQGTTFIISTGSNPWGLPKPQDLQQLNGPIYRTDTSGTIIFESNGRIIRPYTSKP